ncbi:hypothetical protein CFP56_015541 [Quercus suber]|uniref:Uncharacterized protein n=1 Tax=Quercus suber TaxID=58331 RepID=A0AAW0KP66_QUESU
MPTSGANPFVLSIRGSCGVDQGYFIDGSRGNFLKFKKGAQRSMLHNREGKKYDKEVPKGHNS